MYIILTQSPKSWYTKFIYLDAVTGSQICCIKEGYGSIVLISGNVSPDIRTTLQIAEYTIMLLLQM